MQLGAEVTKIRRVAPVIIPRLLQSVDNPLDRIPIQAGTDLQYLRKLADDAGYTFRVTPGPAPGTSTAYWGPKIRAGPYQPALKVNMDAHTNVESLSCSFDSQSATAPLVFIQDPVSKNTMPIAIPPILGLPLGLLPPPVLKIKHQAGNAKLSAPEAVMKGLAEAADSARAISCTGTLKVQRYGRLLKPFQLVGVGGAGDAFNGIHYVDQTTTKLSIGEVTQEFKLSRNEMFSNVPRLPL